MPRSAPSSSRAARRSASPMSCSGRCGRCWGCSHRPARTYEQRDRVMAVYAPMALLALPTVSLVLIFLGFTAAFYGLDHDGWRDALTTSGSCLLTLGFERPPSTPGVLLGFVEAAIGLGLLALLISYLPTIYNAFSRREIAVTDLAVRAGTPAKPWEMLDARPLPGFLNHMDEVWQSWMAWFTEMSETHTSLGVTHVLPFAQPAPLVGHRVRRGTRRGCAPAVGARTSSSRRRPGCASVPAISRCARSPTSSASSTTTIPRPTTRSRSRARSSTRSTSGSARPGVPVRARPRPGLARLRGLARQLRRRAHDPCRARDGSVRSVDVGSFGDPAADASLPDAAAGAASAAIAAGGSTVSSQVRNWSTPATVCSVRIDWNTSNAWCAPRSSA